MCPLWLLLWWRRRRWRRLEEEEEGVLRQLPILFFFFFFLCSKLTVEIPRVELPDCLKYLPRYPQVALVPFLRGWRVARYRAVGCCRGGLADKYTRLHWVISFKWEAIITGRSKQAED